MAGWEAIPGETPIDDVSGLKVRGVATRGELNKIEAENIRKAFVKYLSKRPSRRSAPFDLAWALRLHKEMFGDVWRWAGKPRTCALNIGVPHQHVETRLYDLMKDLGFWEQQGVSLEEQAVRLHHMAVYVHPFLNGNGRWARLLANVWLKQHRSAPTQWPEATVGAENPVRAEYPKAIRAADEGDYEPLLKMHRQFTPSE